MMKGITLFLCAGLCVMLSLTSCSESDPSYHTLGITSRIIDGPLEDFVGIVDELDTDKNYVKVTISMFGRETPVELELNQAEKLED